MPDPTPNKTRLVRDQKIARATNHMTFRLLRDFFQSSLRNGVHDDPWLPLGANDQMIMWVDDFLKELNARMDNEETEIASVEFKKEMRELVNIRNGGLKFKILP